MKTNITFGGVEKTKCLHKTKPGTKISVGGAFSGPRECPIILKEEKTELVEVESTDDSCFETEKAYIGSGMKYPGTDKPYEKDCPSPTHCQVLIENVHMPSTYKYTNVQELCQQNAECEWFNWENTTDSETNTTVTKCWLKKGKGSGKKMVGVTTGPRNCLPKPERHCIEQGAMYIGDGLNLWVRRKNNWGRQKTAAACQVR